MQYSKDVEGENLANSARVKQQSEELKYGCQGALGLNSRVMGGPDPGFHYTERGHVADESKHCARTLLTFRGQMWLFAQMLQDDRNQQKKKVKRREIMESVNTVARKSVSTLWNFKVFCINSNLIFHVFIENKPKSPHSGSVKSMITLESLTSEKLIGVRFQHTWSLVNKMTLEMWARAFLTDSLHKMNTLTWAMLHQKRDFWWATIKNYWFT